MRYPGPRSSPLHTPPRPGQAAARKILSFSPTFHALLILCTKPNNNRASADHLPPAGRGWVTQGLPVRNISQPALEGITRHELQGHFLSQEQLVPHHSH